MPRRNTDLPLTAHHRSQRVLKDQRSHRRALKPSSHRVTGLQKQQHHRHRHLRVSQRISNQHYTHAIPCAHHRATATDACHRTFGKTSSKKEKIKKISVPKIRVSTSAQASLACATPLYLTKTSGATNHHQSALAWLGQGSAIPLQSLRLRHTSSSTRPAKISSEIRLESERFNNFWARHQRQPTLHVPQGGASQLCAPPPQGASLACPIPIFPRICGTRGTDCLMPCGVPPHSPSSLTHTRATYLPRPLLRPHHVRSAGRKRSASFIVSGLLTRHRRNARR